MPSSSAMSVRNTAQSSMTRCQSLFNRDRRDTSVTSTRPTSPSPIAATRRWKPVRMWLPAPDKPRSSSMTSIRRWPAHLLRPFGELVLPTRALLVDQHLPRGRLPDVDECAQVDVAGLDFGRDGVHGTAPLARRFAPASPGAAAAAARLQQLGPQQDHVPPRLGPEAAP